MLHQKLNIVLGVLSVLLINTARTQVDPRHGSPFKSRSHQSTILNTSPSLQFISDPDDANWNDRVHLDSLNGDVNALVLLGNDLYAAGDFTIAGSVNANSIAKWDGTHWSALGSGIDIGGEAQGVYTLAVNGSDLYVGGFFDVAGGINAANLAKWDGSNWSAFPSQIGGTVKALVFMNGELYAGGYFISAGGIPASAIAKWNGSAWSQVGGGMNNNVEALAVVGNDLYAGGWFTMAGGVQANYVAKWNGSQWSPVGYGMNIDVMALTVVGVDLYAGGYFTLADSTPANRIANWNGSQWSALAGGMNLPVYTLLGYRNDLYAGGTFTSAGGLNANHVAVWHGGKWSALGSGLNSTVNAFAARGSNLYVGGHFTVAGVDSSSGIAQWNIRTISGVVFNDFNGNGIRDISDLGLPGWKILLKDSVGIATDSTLSDSIGNFIFPIVTSGSYTLQQVNQAGWIPSLSSSYPVTVVGDDSLNGFLFGNFKLASLSGNIFNDRNANGVKDTSEAGLGGWHANIGNALKLDGVDDYADIGILADLQNATQLTVMAWVKTEPSTNAFPGFVGQWETSPCTNNNTFLLYDGQAPNQHKGIFYLSFDDNVCAYTVGTIDIPEKQWLHIAGTWRNSDGLISLYKGGNLDGTSIGGIGRTLKSQNTNPAMIGSFSSTIPGPDSKLKGEIDEVSVWNRALTQQEIATFMHQRLTGSEPGLIAYYDMDDTSANGISDRTGNGNTGTLIGGAGKIISTAPDIGSVVTDVNGTFQFPSLPVGNYTVTEEQRAGWQQTAPSAGSYSVSISSGDSTTGKDFGNFKLGSISGNVFDDRNENGVIDPGEMGLQNWNVNLEGAKDGNTLLFDGVDDYVTLDHESNFDFTTTDSFTIEAWIKTSSILQEMILSKEGTSNQVAPGYILRMDGGANPVLEFDLVNQFGDAGYKVYGTKKINDGMWHHVAGTYDGTQSGAGIQLYVDGKKDSSVIWLNTDPGNVLNDLSLTIGSKASQNLYNFDGEIDELRIWRRAVTQEQISNNLHRHLDGNETGLVAYYTVDDTSSNSISDLTGNGNTGTFFNGVDKDSSAAPAVGSTTTDANGYFQFPSLPVGNYTITEEQRAGWNQTIPLSGSYSISISSADSITGKDFGNTIEFNSVWDASTHQFPDSVCPPWQLVGTRPTLDADTMVISTSSYPEDSYFIQYSPVVALPDTLAMEFRMKYGSGQTDAFPNRTAAQCSFSFGSNNGNVLWIGSGEMFLWGSYTVRGPSVQIETDTNFHTYRIEVYNQSNIQVFYDNALKLSGLVISDINWGTTQYIDWGEGTGNAYGMSEWLYFKHNASSDSSNANICGKVFNDMNANGAQDSGDSLLSNWKIFLRNSTETIIDSTVTDASGLYSFSAPVDGIYSVEEVTQSGWIQTLPGGIGKYTIHISPGKSFGRLDFGDVQGFQYNDSIGGFWSESQKWLYGHTPGPTDAVLIPKNIEVIVDTLPSDSILSLTVQTGGTLRFSSSVPPLKISQNVHIDAGAIIAFSMVGDSSGLTCYRNFENAGILDPGRSNIKLMGNTPKEIFSIAPRTQFFSLEVAGESTQARGSLVVQSQLRAYNSIYMTSSDSLIIDTNAIDAITGSGILSGGAVLRKIKSDERGKYRFESDSTYVQFSGSTNPSFVAMTSYPKMNPTQSSWIVVPSHVNPISHTIMADSVDRFSRWAVGVIKPNQSDTTRMDTVLINRYYEIAATPDISLGARLSLRYDQSEVPIEVQENSLVLLKSEIKNVAISLSVGWNLLSLPVTLSSAQKTLLYPTAISPAFFYNSSTGYEAHDTIIPGKGFWLKYASPQLLSITGIERTHDSIPVTSGWNMIGSISQPVPVLSITSSPPGIQTTPFFGYGVSYTATDTIYPSKGYWVKVNQDGTLFLSSDISTPSTNNRIKIVRTSETPPSPPGGGMVEKTRALPKEFVLEQNYPNPFNPATTIRYQLPVQSYVTLKVYNVLGQLVRTLIDELQEPGFKSVEWDASHLPSGVYFFQMKAEALQESHESFLHVNKMLLVR
jgi:hypothetical protein